MLLFVKGKDLYWQICFCFTMLAFFATRFWVPGVFASLSADLTYILFCGILKIYMHFGGRKMNFAVILAGGIGTRMGQPIPKQYLLIENKPVLIYTLEAFERCDDIDKFVIVADPFWRDQIRQWLSQYNITKFLDFADPGSTRQDSVYSGLTVCKLYAHSQDDVVVVHDGARAMVSSRLISTLVAGLKGYDGCISVLPMKDAIFISKTGEAIDALVDKATVFSAQTPECFYLLPFWTINSQATPTERAAAVSNYEMGFKHNWRIHICPGDENNFKLTTPADIDRMIGLLHTDKS